MIYVIADVPFNHEKILKYCNRQNQYMFTNVRVIFFATAVAKV